MKKLTTEQCEFLVNRVRGRFLTLHKLMTRERYDIGNMVITKTYVKDWITSIDRGHWDDYSWDIAMEMSNRCFRIIKKERQA